MTCSKHSNQLVAFMQQGGSSGDLHTTSLELRDELLNLAELCGADRGVVGRMRKKDGPGVGDEVVKHDFAGGGVRFEVGYGFSEIEGHRNERAAQVLPACKMQLLFWQQVAPRRGHILHTCIKRVVRVR